MLFIKIARLRLMAVNVDLKMSNGLEKSNRQTYFVSFVFRKWAKLGGTWERNEKRNETDELKERSERDVKLMTEHGMNDF